MAQATSLELTLRDQCDGNYEGLVLMDRNNKSITSSLSDFRCKSFVFNNGPFQPETVNTVI